MPAPIPRSNLGPLQKTNRFSGFEPLNAVEEAGGRVIVDGVCEVTDRAYGSADVVKKTIEMTGSQEPSQGTRAEPSGWFFLSAGLLAVWLMAYKVFKPLS